MEQFALTEDDMRHFKNHLQECYKMLDREQTHTNNVDKYDKDFTHFISKKIKFNQKLCSKLALKYSYKEKEEEEQKCSVSSNEVSQLEEQYQQRLKQIEDKTQNNKKKMELQVDKLGTKLDGFIDQINEWRYQQLQEFQQKTLFEKLNEARQTDDQSSNKVFSKIIAQRNKFEQVNELIRRHQDRTDYQIEQQDQLVQSMLEMERELEQYD